jgi:hypothetical protein
MLPVAKTKRKVLEFNRSPQFNHPYPINFDYT